GAIHNLTASLAQKFMEDGSGIRVNAVAPGPVWTPLIPSTIPDHPEFGKENSPMGRPAQPAEIAPIYVFLASSGASYVSGATIAATGVAIALETCKSLRFVSLRKDIEVLILIQVHRSRQTYALFKTTTGTWIYVS